MKNFASDGFTAISNLLDVKQCEAIAETASFSTINEAGSRNMLSECWCASLANELQAHRELAALIPRDFVPAQCTHFDKSPAQNWLVAMHQDLSIPVASHIDHPALGVWSEKEGVAYVQPPIELLEQLVAVRIHIDRCSEDDGPLRVIAGTHQRGRIGAADIAAIRQEHSETICTGDRGSAIVMRPLLLHASSKIRGTKRRRVLHFLFGPHELPYGLRWHGKNPHQSVPNF
jgi:Phytanoyl-CoA dioxygenase (PhyH)